MIQELKKLNKIKRNLILMWIGCIIAWIILYYFAGFGNLIPDKFYSFSMILSSVVLLILFPFLLWFYFLSQIEKTFILYVLSIIKDWKLSIPRKATVRREPWHIEVLPPQEFVFSSILPIYGNQFHLIDAFSAENTIQSKSIAQIQYANLSKGNNKPPYVATLITIKNSKNLNSTTCFKTNNYPPKTNKDIIQEKSKIELPKIDLNNATENNIDVYTNNQNIAEKLATQELFTALQNVKEQLNSPYVKAIFHNDYIIFVLRQKGYNYLNYSTFFIKIPLFKNIDYPLLEQAVNNFKTLTDLANQAPEFTKNI